jgi:nucleotide-binding universal stress UspA family protein
MKFNKVVIAVDFAEQALETLSQIRDMELSPNAEVHLVHVFEYTFMNFEILPGTKMGKDEFLIIEKAMLEKLETVRQNLGLGKDKTTLKCLISVGAKQEFVQYIDEIRPDLVIAATQEKQGLAGFFEGSFTAFLNKFSRSNLLLLRPLR